MHNNSSISSSNLQAAPQCDAPVMAGNGTQWAIVVRLILKITALLTAVALVVLAIVVLVPDGNDYAKETVDKHARLAASASRKIVFVGGSNLAYGLDSALVQQELGGHVVNMGMNGYLGLRFMLEEVKQHVHKSDIVVISPEYDSYYRSSDGIGPDLLMIVKTRPESLLHLTQFMQWKRVAHAVPVAAQQKLMRMLSAASQEGLGRLHELATGHRTADPVREQLRFISSIECHACFNSYGDLTSHLDLTWPYEKEDGINATSETTDANVFRVLQEYSEEMTARGVHVYLVPAPVLASYYNRHKRSIQNLNSELTKADPLRVLSSPERYVFADSFFFDTVYHLNREGRAIRTRKVIEDLRMQLASSGGMGR